MSASDFNTDGRSAIGEDALEREEQADRACARDDHIVNQCGLGGRAFENKPLLLCFIEQLDVIAAVLLGMCGVNRKRELHECIFVSQSSGLGVERLCGCVIRFRCDPPGLPRHRHARHVPE